MMVFDVVYAHTYAYALLSFLQALTCNIVCARSRHAKEESLVKATNLIVATRDFFICLCRGCPEGVDLSCAFLVLAVEQVHEDQVVEERVLAQWCE